ncbi:hypothetical protein BDZ97DRAFT_1001617 [Flammula alnicola]|nr:hypothetical protein BDZ97DRAFT_1001617 [Flammula alnicola]
MVVYEILRSLDIDVGNAAFSWYLTLMSMGVRPFFFSNLTINKYPFQLKASRLILNIRKIAATHNRRRRQSFSEISGSDDESINFMILATLSTSGSFTNNSCFLAPC